MIIYILCKSLIFDINQALNKSERGDYQPALKTSPKNYLSIKSVETN